MKAVKIIVGLLLAIVLAVVVVTVVLLGNINSLVKTTVEEVGSDVLGTQVTLAEVDIQLTEAKGVLRGLQIQNPQGFSDAKLLSMSEVLLDLSVQALQDQLVIVEQVRIAGAKVLAEQVGSTTNVQALLKHLEKTDSSSASSSEQGSSAADNIRIRIDRFDFEDASAKVVSDKLGETTLDMPNINLTKVGGDKGLPPNQLADALITPIVQSLKSSMEGMLKQLAEKKVREELKKQEDKAREKLKDKEDELKAKLESKLDDDEKQKLDSLKSLFKK